MKAFEMLNDLEARSMVVVCCGRGFASGRKAGHVVKAASCRHGRGTSGKGSQTIFYLDGVRTSRANVIAFFDSLEQGTAK